MGRNYVDHPSVMLLHLSEYLCPLTVNIHGSDLLIYLPPLSSGWVGRGGMYMNIIRFTDPTSGLYLQSLSPRWMWIWVGEWTWTVVDSRLRPLASTYSPYLLGEREPGWGTRREQWSLHSSDLWIYLQSLSPRWTWTWVGEWTWTVVASQLRPLASISSTSMCMALREMASCFASSKPWTNEPNIDTKAKCLHLKYCPVKGLCGRCFSEFIDWRYMMVFSTQLSEQCINSDKHLPQNYDI
jgi:hypothetical protein